MPAFQTQNYYIPFVGIFIVLCASMLIFIANPSFFQNLFSSTPHPGSCLILEEKNCTHFTLLPDPLSSGLIAAYSVPKGSVVFAPVTGYYSETGTFYFKNKATGVYSTYPGIHLDVGESNRTKDITAVYSFIFYNQQSNKALAHVSKGEPIGIVGNKPIASLGNYNLVIRIVKIASYILGRNHFDPAKVTYADGTKDLKTLLHAQ